MPQAAFTRELRARLRVDGEATIYLDDLESASPRLRFDSDAQYRDRLIARARQRLYWAAYYERLRVATQVRGNRVIGVVEGPSAGALA